MTSTPEPPERDATEKSSDADQLPYEPTVHAGDADIDDEHTAEGEESTGFVPTFQPNMPKTDPLQDPEVSQQPFDSGRCLGDFQILGVLGKGAFATVYLARQISLGRQVALKVSENRGSEARTLASLEHNHIVQVYSEVVEEQANLRLLCMQFVAGTTLAKVISQLRRVPKHLWHGNVIIELIDSLSVHTTTFDPTAVREREYLGRCSYLEAVCWMGAQLAEALSHAHLQGVYHRDIKPSNILINRYGRPLLADFNISKEAEGTGGPGEMFGGTLGYMAPEHVDAFNPLSLTPPEVVDARSDIYSFGVVLFEFLTGAQPFHRYASGQTLEKLKLMAKERREETPEKIQGLNTHDCLKQVLHRCLRAEPKERYQSASELVVALSDCRERLIIDDEMPPTGFLGRWAHAFPVTMVTLLILFPHVLGSIFNITYNRLRIVEALSESQRSLFVNVTLAYNAIVYPLSLALLIYLCKPILDISQQLFRGELVSREDAAIARQRAARLPLVTILVSCLGWFPGGVLFPWVLDRWGGGLSETVFGHFALSFTLSGLIAVTYSALGAELIVWRELYPRFLVEPGGLRLIARQELAPILWRHRILPFLAGMIPLVGAILLVGVAPEQFDPEQYRTYRYLVAGLIGLGMVGFGAALVSRHMLERATLALLGTSRRMPSQRPSIRVEH